MRLKTTEAGRRLYFDAADIKALNRMIVALELISLDRPDYGRTRDDLVKLREMIGEKNELGDVDTPGR